MWRAYLTGLQGSRNPREWTYKFYLREAEATTAPRIVAAFGCFAYALDAPGTIRLDGIDIREFSFPTLHARMALVSQDVWLLNRTLRDNLTFGLARDVSDVLEALELPYRVMLLCSGDLSFAAAKCYDFEVWAPGMQAWQECSSCSNFEEFQARRMNMRFRREAGAKAEVPHTLNASGLALPRTFATLLEIHQTADGGVRIPVALRPYLDGLEELRP